MFETKLAESIGTSLLKMTGATSVWSITFSAIFIGILVSETSSNTASATMVVPVIIALSQAAGVNPIPPAIGGLHAAGLYATECHCVWFRHGADHGNASRWYIF